MNVIKSKLTLKITKTLLKFALLLTIILSIGIYKSNIFSCSFNLSSDSFI